MDIKQACQTLRRCNDMFLTRQPMTIASAEVGDAARTLKLYIERARGDGRPIRELELIDQVLCTPVGIRGAMPFVFSAEAMLALERRKQLG